MEFGAVADCLIALLFLFLSELGRHEHPLVFHIETRVRIHSRIRLGPMLPRRGLGERRWANGNRAIFRNQRSRFSDLFHFQKINRKETAEVNVQTAQLPKK